MLSIERYLAIRHALSYDEKRIRKILWLVFPAIWISGFIGILPDQIFYTVKDRICYFEVHLWPIRDAMFLYSFYIGFNFLIPGLTMVVLYTKMGIVIWRSQREHKLMTQNDTKRNTLVDAQRNIFYTCVILLSLYFSCWLMNGLNMLLYISQQVNYSPIAFHFSANLLVLNSAINPFIYTIRYREFQQHFKRLIFMQMS